jgi:hypothetical protein
MATINFQENVSLGGVSFNTYYPKTGNSQIPNLEEALAAGQAGTLTTMTDFNTGVATLTTGHGIITSDICDIFWTGGCRYGMTATVATNAVTLDGGTGEPLPAQDTVVVVCKQQTINIDFATTILVALRILCDQRAHVGFRSSTGALLGDKDLTASEPFVWNDSLPQPFINLGLSAQLTTRTDDNTGVATCLTGHGIETADVVDAYWLGGFRLGMTANTSSNAVTLDGGTGDVLPLVNTAVILVNVTDDGYPDVASVVASNGTATAATLKIGGLANA